MTAVVVLLACVVALLALLVVGLLRSHAEILKRLHDLGAGVEPGPEPNAAATARAGGPVERDEFQVMPQVPSPPEREGFTGVADLAGATAGGQEVATVRVAGVEHDTVIAFLSSGCITCQKFWDAFRKPRKLQLPKGTRLSDGLAGLDHLRFLRRDQAQVMGRQIEELLQRQGLAIPNRFELDSNQSISALVAGGHAWTITTPLSLLRAGRFLDGIDARPLPFDGTSRRVVLCATGDWSGDVPRQISDIARDLIEQHFTEPGLDQMPWLRGSFRILTDD